MGIDVDGLVGSISAENQVILDLISLADSKKQAIIMEDIDGLTDIMRRENQLIHALERAEAGRLAESSALARALGLGEEGLTASSLLDRLRTVAPSEAARLEKELADLAGNLERLKDMNRHNTALLEQSLAYVENMEALLTRQRQTTYSAGGSVEDSPTRSVLDRRV
ncbi:MAG: flagellar protein FlgN [Syntrophomonadales bacterium]|jgi:flagellar biosynthesis/type III secretory pathway chaperone